MSILGSIIGLITPYDCLACGAEGDLLCHACALNLSRASGLPNFDTLNKIQAATVYQGVAKDLVWVLKSAGAQTAAKVMATQIIKRAELNNVLIVPVPTATSRIRQRGYDQAKLIARELARQTGLPYLDCLVRLGQTHQVGASRQQRLGQLRNSFYVKKAQSIKGVRIILIDDVTTTGATLEVAARALRDGGVTSVEAAVFAYAEPLKLSSNSRQDEFHIF